MPKVDLQIKNAAKRVKLERLKYQAARFKAGYEILDDRNRRQRRRSKIEIGGEDRQAKPGDRLKMINYARDLWRNFSQAKGMLRQLTLNVVGPGPQVTFTTDDPEWNDEAERWFNVKWAKRSDAIGDRHFGEQMRIAFLSSIIDGDVLCWFEDGKLWWREADQMPTISSGSWKKGAKDDPRFLDKTLPPDKPGPMLQADGLVFDSEGRVHWHVIHGGHGAIEAKFKDVTFIPKEIAKLLKNPWRFDQRRGWSELATSGSELWDIKEMREHELQSAKVAAAWAMQITKMDAREEQIARSDRPDAADIDDPPDAQDQNYEAFERLTAGAIEYMNAGEKAEVIDNKRPASNVEPFFNHVSGSAGHSLGLPKLFSILRADGSYSASRAELNLADTLFTDFQVHMSRNMYDPVLTMAISWAMSNRQLPKRKDWEDRWTWKHPRLQPIDATREAKALKEKMLAGLTSFTDVLGPDWKDKFEQLAKEKEEAQRLKLNLDVFPTEAQAVAKANGSVQATAEAFIEAIEMSQDN